MVTIYSSKGIIRFETPINIGSKRAYKLMGDDYITLVFSVKNPINFAFGDYCDIQNIGRFELCEPYKPTYNRNTGGYDYELKLDAQYIKWRNKIMRYLPRIGGNEASFTLTATAEVHMEMILANVNALATERLSDGTEESHPNYLHNGQRKWVVSIDESVDASAKSLSYDGINIIDALTQIAEAYDCEWWINGNIICLGKCEETNDYVDLELGVNVAEMSHSNSREDLATRILVFGGDRNISPRYRKDLIFNVTKTANNGNRICDGTRVLKSEWFAESQRVDAPGSSFALAFTSTKSETVSSSSSSDVLIHSVSQKQSNVEAGEWKIALSKYKPTVTFEDREGSCWEWMCKISLSGVTQDNVPKQLEEYAQTMHIHSLGVPIQAYFQDQVIKLDEGLKTLIVSVHFYAKLQGKSSIKASVYPGNGVSIGFTKSDPRYRIGGLTIDKIDSSGKVIATYADATFNPDYAEGYSEKNVIQLPYGASMAVGDRFKIREIITSKVKSSYFSSQYSAYEDMGSVITNGVVTNRLMLPISYGKPYVDYKEGMTMEEGVEDVVVFEDIYPKATCMITSVETVDRKETVKNDDGSQSDRTFTAFKIKDDFFTAARPFDNDYKIPNKNLEITFGDGKRYKEGDAIPSGKKVGELIYPNSGKLNGWTFEVQFTKDKDDSAVWEIVRDNESYIPNDILRPEVGDTFVLTGCDIAVVNELYTDEAEKELLETALRYVAKINIDPSTYDCTMMPDVMKNGLTLGIGKRVNLLNSAYFEHETDADGKVWGRKSRVIGYEYPLDIPWDNPVYTIGEKAAYSRFGEIEDKIDAINISMSSLRKNNGSSSYSNEQSSNVAGGSIYVIGQSDSTPPSETNVFSALRSIMEFCSKKASETINYLWHFSQGLKIGNYVENNSGASIDAQGDAEFGSVTVREDVTVGGEFVEGSHGARIWKDERGNIHFETDYITARKKFRAKEIEVQEQTWVGGYDINSPAGMRCSRVEPLADAQGNVVAYRCFFNAKDGEGIEVRNQFKAGDLARCETFNLERDADGLLGNHYYWRRVNEVGASADGSEHFITLSNIPAEMDANSLSVPKAGDSIITVGNDTDPDRQNIIIEASVGEGSPYLYQYVGINTFSLADGKLKTRISPKGNLFTGKFVIENTGQDVVDYIADSPHLNAYRLELSPESAVVACDSEGNPTAALPTATFDVYRGSVAQSDWQITHEAVGCFIRREGNAFVVTSLAADNATVLIEASKAGCPKLSRTLTICKARRGANGSEGKDGAAGTDGENAVQYVIEPTPEAVVTDMEGNCEPSEVSCKVFRIDGENARVEVGVNGAAADANLYTLGGSPLTAGGELLGQAIAAFDTSSLRLRYVAVNQDYVTDSAGNTYANVSEDPEADYAAPIVMTERVRHVIFKLYDGNKLIAARTVTNSLDAGQMKVVYNTRFEVTDRKIEAEASRISDVQTDVANLRVTAQEIASTVECVTGMVDEPMVLAEAGRNLLVGTSKGAKYWEYSTQSKTPWTKADDGTSAAVFRTAARADSVFEVFTYPLRPQLVKAGEDYVLSFTLANRSSQELTVNISLSKADNTSYLSAVQQIKIPALTERDFRLSYKATDSGTADSGHVLRFGMVNASLNRWTEIRFANLMLTKGADLSVASSNMLSSVWDYATDSATKASGSAVSGGTRFTSASRSDGKYASFRLPLASAVKRNDECRYSVSVRNGGSKPVSIQVFVAKADASALLCQPVYRTVPANSSVEINQGFTALTDSSADHRLLVNMVGASVNEWTSLTLTAAALYAGVGKAHSWKAAPEDKYPDDFRNLKTQITQTADKISLIAKNFDAQGNVSKESGIVTVPEGNTLYALDKNGKLVSVIDQTAAGIKISAEDIKLEGATSINGKVKIDDDGLLRAEDANVSGTLTANQLILGVDTFGETDPYNNVPLLTSSMNVCSEKYNYFALPALPPGTTREMKLLVVANNVVDMLNQVLTLFGTPEDYDGDPVRLCQEGNVPDAARSLRFKSRSYKVQQDGSSLAKVVNNAITGIYYFIGWRLPSESTTYWNVLRLDDSASMLTNLSAPVTRNQDDLYYNIKFDDLVKSLVMSHPCPPPVASTTP